MEEESRKRQVSECERECKVYEKVAGKNPRTTARDEVIEQEDMLAGLTLDEESVMELSKLLEPSGATSYSALEQCKFKVKFIDNPYTTPVIVQSSSAYVTINGNEESCGSSFSDSESSVMASVDRCSVRSAVAECSEEFRGGAWGLGAMEAHEWVECSGDAEGFFVKEMDGCDWLRTEYDIDIGDDDMWEKFLGHDFFGGSW